LLTAYFLAFHSVKLREIWVFILLQLDLVDLSLFSYSFPNLDITVTNPQPAYSAMATAIQGKALIVLAVHAWDSDIIRFDERIPGTPALRHAAMQHFKIRCHF